MAENDTFPAGVERSSGFADVPRVGSNGLIIAFGLFFLAFIPTLLIQGNQLWSRPHYQFFPLAILGAAALAMRAWHRLGNEDLSPRSPRTVKTLLFVSLGLLILGIALHTGWFGGVSLLILITALLSMGGPKLFRVMIPSLLMLSLLIYPPLHLDRDLVLWLRHFAIWASGGLLDVLHVPHFVFGNTIEIRGHKLLVEEACSGINSVFFIGAASLFYGLWRERHWRRIASLLAAAFSFVLLGNVIRIAAGAFLKYRFEIDILTGWKHETAGLIIFSTALGLVWNFDRLMFEFFAPLPARNAKTAQPAKPEQAPPLRPPDIVGRIASAFPSKTLIGSAIVFAGIGILHGALMLTEHGPVMFAFRNFPGLKPSATFSMPELIDGWVKTTNTQAGPIEREISLDGKPLHSRQWAYQKGRMLLWLSLDYPYADRHDLTICYKLKGWDFNRSADFDSVNVPSVIELDMMQKPLKNGYLTFTQFLGNGRWFTGPLGRRFADRVGHGPVYQLQAVVVRTDSLTDQEKVMVRSFFQEAKKQLSRQVTAQIERNP